MRETARWGRGARHLAFATPTVPQQGRVRDRRGGVRAPRRSSSAAPAVGAQRPIGDSEPPGEATRADRMGSLPGRDLTCPPRRSAATRIGTELLGVRERGAELGRQAELEEMAELRGDGEGQRTVTRTGTAVGRK